MWGYPEPHTVSKNAASSGSGADTDEVVTLAAVTDERHVIDDIHWSYDDASTTGKLTITDDGTSVFDIDLIAAAAVSTPSIHFENGLECTLNSEVVITLAGAGGTTNGKLNVNYR